MPTDTQPQGDRVLLTTVQAVLEGKATVEKLLEVVEQSRQSMADSLADFKSSYEGLGPEGREACASLVETAEQLFAIMAQAIDMIARYAESADPNDLRVGLSQVDRASFQINMLSLDFRNKALAAEGPTEIPQLNLLIKFHEAYQKDPQANFEPLREAVQFERVEALKALDALDKEPDISEVASMKAAFDEHLRCMNRLANALDEKKAFQIDKELHQSRQTFGRIKELMPVVQMALRGHGPTAYPDINMIIKLARDVEEQRVSESILVDALETVAESFGETREKIASISGEGDSALLKEELERAQQAFDMMEEAIDEFDEFFEGRMVHVLRSAATKIEQAAVEMEAAYKGVLKVADREGKTPCVKCGHYNPIERQICESCGAPLPVKAGTARSTFETSEGPARQATGGGEPFVTTNLFKVYQAVNAIDAGEITPDEFTEVLNWFENLVEVNYNNAPEPDEEGGEAAEALEEMFVNGVEEIRKGIACLRDYLESGLQAQFQNGVREIDQGARKLATIADATRPGQAAEAGPAGE